MRRFNLDEAIAGLPVITRTGKPVTIIAVLADDVPAPVVANVHAGVNNFVDTVWSGTTRILISRRVPCDYSRTENFYKNGRVNPFVEHGYDLFMADGINMALG